MSHVYRAVSRNAVFASHAPRILALKLACERRALHVAIELWDVLVLEFLLPRYFNK